MTRIVFMGTPDFSVPVLKQIIEDGFEVIAVVTQPDRPVGRKKILTPPPVKVEALNQGIPVYQPDKIREKAELEKIIALEPDLIVTAAFGQILPNELLEYPKYGCINVHASLLPELRGGAPIHYSILQGKEKTGITIMYMAEKLDAGDILTQVEVPIEERDTVGILHDKLSLAGSNLLSETLPKLLAGQLTAIKQDEEQATFASNIKRSDEKINWSRSGEEIYNQIRGLNPWPVAYTTLHKGIVKVWWAEKSHTSANLSPGTIIDIDEESFTVATGNDTALKIIELQPSGKKKMTAAEFLRGAGSQLAIGDQLGDLNE
ncbi:methionyl-tRNA formyltransferase [Bacillus sp. 03113]|uniref:methionyl-tRNA formyltransferase n=1 Tax=Bacillus sp. 03113 TaxID=2578211 RepID=UPI001144AB73|nr:methionyl-tRNA formyltransferase [Bacillus sp. 03113]